VRTQSLLLSTGQLWLALALAAWPAGAQGVDLQEGALTTQGARLAPRDEIPTLYHIAVELGPLWTYKAIQRVTYTNNEDVTLHEVVFHLYPNAGYMLEGKHGKNVLLKRVKVDGTEVTPVEEGTLVTVPLSPGLRPKISVEIEMTFVGRLPSIDDGADLSATAMEQLQELLKMLTGDGALGGGLKNFGIFGTTGQIGSMALWHPVVAAHDERGWDRGTPEEMGDFSYFDAADFKVAVRAPREMRIAAGGVTTAQRLVGDQQEIICTATRARELTLQVSSDYRRASGEVGEIRVNSWFLADHASTGMDVLTYAMRSVAAYEREFGPYPYRELDVVEAPLLGGVAGVEFPGLCTIATMFYQDAGAAAGDPMARMMSSPYMQDTLEFVVAHEVAHQWWNATVGSDSRGHPFIDEALANYSAVRYFEVVHSPSKAQKVLQMQVLLNYHMSRMMGNPDRPVDLPTSEFTDMVEYVATVYGKGAMFYLALRDAVGEAVFSQAIQAYYRDRYLAIAGPMDLPDQIKRIVPEQAAEVDDLCQRWLHEAHGDEDLGTMDMTDMLSVMLEMMGDTGTELDPWLHLFSDLLELSRDYDWDGLLGGSGW
jgi:hypothetical protein